MRDRPRPLVIRDNEFFWEAVQRRELVVQECDACGALRYPPLPSCPECRHLMWTPRQMTGRGVIYSFVVPRRPGVPFLEDGYIVALVELDEGPRIVTNILGASPEDVRIGMPVEVCFEDLPDGTVLPQFRPRERSEAE